MTRLLSHSIRFSRVYWAFSASFIVEKPNHTRTHTYKWEPILFFTIFLHRFAKNIFFSILALLFLLLVLLFAILFSFIYKIIIYTFILLRVYKKQMNKNVTTHNFFLFFFIPLFLFLHCNCRNGYNFFFAFITTQRNTTHS